MLELKLLALILVANGAPVVTWDVFREHYTFPIDRGIFFADGRPLLGHAKTWRGLGASVAITPLVAMLLGLHWETGLRVAVAAMIGDLFSSFIKRRLGIETSGKAWGLDQIPESLFPLLAVKDSAGLDWLAIGLLTGAFFILEVTLSPVLYRLGIRKRPY